MRLLATLTIGLAFSALLPIAGTYLFNGGTFAHAEQETPKAEGSQQKTDLKISKHTDLRIQGSVSDEKDRPLAKFNSQLRETKDSQRASGTTDDARSKIVETRIEAGNLTVSAERDMQAEKVSFGADGTRLTAPQKHALTALCKGTESSFGVLGTSLPQEDDLLVRTACYYAGAQPGYKLDNRILEGPATVHLQDEPSAQASATGPPQDGMEFVNASYQQDLTAGYSAAPTQQECERAEASGDYTTFVACQRNGEDGVIEFGNCGPHSNILRWDSENPRLCYGSRGDIPNGPCTTDCKGRCGVGCGNSKNGFYTRDCAEHDDCSRRTNASGGLFDQNCGDEFDEAADDFFQRYKRTCSSCVR